MHTLDDDDQPVRACAQRIIEAMQCDAAKQDPDAFAVAVASALTALTEIDGLENMGIPRQGNNVATSQYLYYDGALSIILFEVPLDASIPPHDHGVWEAFCVYRGRVRHKVFSRADDASVPGYAELKLLEEKIMERGDVSIVAPPADIHGFGAQTPGTMGITVVAGTYKTERHYYQPESNSYVVKTPVNMR